MLDADKRRLLPSSKRITLSSFGASAWKSLSSIGRHNSVSKLILLDIFSSYFSSTATFCRQCPIFFRALPSGDYNQTAQLVRNNVVVCGMPPEVSSRGHLPLTRHGADSQSRLCCDGAFCSQYVPCNRCDVDTLAHLSLPNPRYHSTLSARLP